MGNQARDELEHGGDTEPRLASMKRSSKPLLDHTLAAELAELGIGVEDVAREPSYRSILT